MQPLPFAGVMLFLPGCFCRLIAPKTVSATLGTSVSVQCEYNEKYTGNRKYWCRGPGSSCRKIVETLGADVQVRAGRVSIEDDHLLRRFTMTIDDVSKKDVGVYGCGVTVKGGEDMVAPVNITVTMRKRDDPDHSELSSASFPKLDFISVSSTIYVSVLISVGLKIPIFLCLAFAIIWMHRRGRQHSEERMPPYCGKTQHVLFY